jgi:hypothetical protein
MGFAALIPKNAAAVLHTASNRLAMSHLNK